MRAIALTRQNLGGNQDLLIGMHRLRRRVFKERLDWSVSVAGDLEIDHFDTFGPTYLLVVDDRDVIGSVRLLPTTGSNMLADTFAILLDGNPAPRSQTIWESSRFCVDTTRTDATTDGGLRRATFLLLAAMIEAGLRYGLEAIVTVTDLRMERILRRAGWPLERIGTPHRIGNTQAVAGFLPVSAEALDAIRRSGDLNGAVLEFPAPLALAA